MTHLVPVLAAPLLDPGAGRVELQLPGGMTVAEMVAAAMPAISAADQSQLRVTLVSERGMTVLPQSAWAISRPRPGVRLVIRLVPGDGALRSIMMIVVTVVAFALAGPLATAWVGATGIGSLGTATGLITAGLTVVGSMLVSALVPVKAPKADEVDKRYTLGQFKNEVRANQPVPELMGRIRMAPPFAATSYTEVIGNNQYVRALFCFGPGPMTISDIKIGDTSIDSYDDVEMEIRKGWPDDEPCLLYPRQVLEEATNTEFTLNKPLKPL
ncbi:phage tail fiber protein (plasmid) [Frigidibacter mobilis]|uniref:Phage tail fiber protein n=2 Tax=Frigidibacter mobilis TaxID=1335048 RepID=A0A159ZBJ3_9RHOB|nr:phage tail fiber protein [Frigidibacter mobilis]